MDLTLEQREQVTTAVKRFAADLNLTDDQKEKLQNALEEARLRIKFAKYNPNATKSDMLDKVAANRDLIRQHIASFLSPEQLKKWDADIAQTKEFLGQKTAA
jgi:periplasmic protein CpxP/Spy